MATQAGAKIVLGDQLTTADLKVGIMIAIQNTYANSTTQDTDWNGWFFDTSTTGTKIISEKAAWRLVAAPTDEQGRAQYYLQNVDNGLYMGATYDGKPAGGYKTCNIDSAYVIRFEDYNQTKTDKYDFNEKSVVALFDYTSWPETTKHNSLNMQGNGKNVSVNNLMLGLASFMGLDGVNGAPLNIYLAKEEKDYAFDLQTLIETIAQSGEEFPAGTDPGFFDEGAVSAYENAMNNAMALLAGGAATDQQYIDAKDEINRTLATVRNAYLPISDGYYYLVSAYDNFLTAQDVEKAMSTTDSTAVWNTLDATNPDYVWQFVSSGDNYQLLNLGTNRYLGHGVRFGSSSKKFYVTKELENEITFDFKGAGQWQIKYIGLDPFGKLTANGLGICAYNTDNGNAVSGDIGTGYTLGNNILGNTDCWYLRRISAEMQSQLAEIIAANNRVKTLQSLVEEANTLVEKILVYKTTGNGLITTAGNGVEGNQITFTSIHTQGIEGADDYKFLIDNLDSTYMQGDGTINVNISATPSDRVAITYSTRAATTSYPNAGQWGLDERPANVVLYASKSNGEDSAWVKIDSTNMTQLGVPAKWFVELGDSYSYLRLVVKDNALGRNYFTLSEFQVYKYEDDTENSQYFSVSGMKDAVDALRVQSDSAAKAVAAKSVSPEQLAAMQSALQAVKALYSDTTSLKELIAVAEALIPTATVGDEIGNLTDESAATTLQAAIDAAKDPALYTAPLNKAGIDQASATLNSAMDAFRHAIRMPDPSKWYYIRSATSTDLRNDESGTTDAKCFGSVLYSDGNNASSILKWGYVDANGDMTNIYSPSTMWRIVPIEGTSNYTIQNLGSGLYLGELPGSNIAIHQSETPVAYSVALLGESQFALISQNSANSQQQGLYCGGKATNILTTEAVVNGNGAWKFTAVVPEEIEGITISTFANNLIDVMTLPYDVEDITSFNDNVHVYGIRKITQEENTEGQLVSTIELYEKHSLKAGEPCIIVLGDTAENVPCESLDLFFPFPTTVTSTPIAANGLTGVLSEAKCAAGTGISTAKRFIPMEKDGIVPSQTGVIDPSKYTGEVTGVSTDYTLTAIGLKPQPTASKADVNGDGQINSADITVVYNYIANGGTGDATPESVDVNGDGQINSADIATIYSQIAGGDAASKAYAQKILRLLEK